MVNVGHDFGKSMNLASACQYQNQWHGLLHQLQGLNLGIKLHLISLSASLPSPQTVRQCGAEHLVDKIDGVLWL